MVEFYHVLFENVNILPQIGLQEFPGILFELYIVIHITHASFNFCFMFSQFVPYTCGFKFFSNPALSSL